MSVQVLPRVVEIGLVYKEGPVLIHIPHEHVEFIETSSTGVLTIRASGQEFSGSGITNEKSKELRQQLGWEIESN